MAVVRVLTASGRVFVASMKQEEARQAVLSAYDRWAKQHPNQASMMGGFLFFRYFRQKGRTFSISVRLGASGQSFTAGFKIGCKTRLASVQNDMIHATVEAAPLRHL